MGGGVEAGEALRLAGSGEGADGVDVRVAVGEKVKGAAVWPPVSHRCGSGRGCAGAGLASGSVRTFDDRHATASRR